MLSVVQTLIQNFNLFCGFCKYLFLEMRLKNADILLMFDDISLEVSILLSLNNHLVMKGSRTVRSPSLSVEPCLVYNVN